MFRCCKIKSNDSNTILSGYSNTIADKSDISKLHELVLDGRYTDLQLELSSISNIIIPFQGMSLYHTFVIGAAYRAHYNVKNMFAVLEEYKHITGDNSQQTTETEDIIIHWHGDPDKMIDGHYIIISFLSHCGKRNINFPSKVTTPERFNLHNHRLQGLSPLQFALTLNYNIPNKDALFTAILLLEKENTNDSHTDA